MKEISLHEVGIKVMGGCHSETDSQLTIDLLKKIAELTIESDGLRKNLAQKNATIVAMSQQHERNDVALKFALALSTVHEEPVMAGFELADEFLSEIKRREKMQ